MCVSVGKADMSIIELKRKQTYPVTFLALIFAVIFSS